MSKVDLKTAVAEVRRHARELEERGRLGMTRDFVQHGDVSVHAHVHAVALASARFALWLERRGIAVDRDSLIRGALLHDYFLYDWHIPDPSHRLHGFTHPFDALARAEEDFVLNERERDIILRHMFPLVPIPPRFRESWIVCMADKVCALRETIVGRIPGRVRRTACDEVL
ncbi:MAG: phosphohydrolase [Collinsella sp.]|nr:phosphohydrolase [Collinsella sp.]